MKAGDRPLYDLVEEFWTEYLTYNAYIHPTFEGTFTIASDDDIEYTLKSQFLVNVTLTGDKDTDILGNDQHNRLAGNSGSNRIEGGAGDDVIAGGAGSDIAVFSGVESEYRIETSGSSTSVADKVEGRDGTDKLTGVEVLAFQDKEVAIQ